MSKPVVVVTDYVFPNLEPTEQIMAELGAELRVAKSRETADVLAVSRDADGIISCYSDMNAEVIGQLLRPCHGPSAGRGPQDPIP